VSGDKVAQIFNPVDLDAWRPEPREEARAAFGLPAPAKVVVWHGRVARWQKGLDVLFDAWQRVCRDRPDQDLRLMMLGTGPDAREIHERLASLSVANIAWTDAFVADRAVVRRFLSAGDVYAFPSRQEGFAIAPMEAMACGLPVVATDVPGISDVFINGAQSGGIVVPPDNAAAFAQALGHVLDDDGWRCTLAARARSRIADSAFSLNLVGLQLRERLLDAA
jgi:starch synthase